ncbi:MAG: hypothetical protein EP344_05360 [Bacteroidetes bacterium]|nr:MAG: hypothetical protein EP344_05360 [Bacteroidota bacterium]
MSILFTGRSILLPSGVFLLLRQIRMKQLTLLACILGLIACARPIAPEGGPKDTTPPGLVPEKSTPNLSTRFEGRSFQLTFDEWVTLQDVGTQVLISPPLAKRPEVTLKGRTVTFRFDESEELRPNTTYTINFGTAVKDLHEGNPAKDLRFVFSTGDYIDSLSVSGSVVNAQTGDPMENISILLYDVADDSIITKERPYYMARSDKSGQFSIPNVRAGRFKCVAIEDANQNLKWDGETEQIGFPDSMIVVNDSLRSLPAIRVFKPEPRLRMLRQEINRFGLVKIFFNGPPDTVQVQPADLPGLRTVRHTDQDTILLWYDNPDSTAWNLLVLEDTVPVKAFSRNGFLQKHSMTFRDERPPAPVGGQQRQGRQTTPQTPAVPIPRLARTVNVYPNKPVLLPFNSPVETIDTSKCRIQSDSVDVRMFLPVRDTADPRAVQVLVDWQPGVRYDLTLLPGAVVDLFGVGNTDTLLRSFTVPETKQLGILNLTVGDLEPGQPYLLRLLNNNELESERTFTADSSSVRFVFSGLQPVTYTAQLISDDNRNRRWDPGAYYLRRQPERIVQKKLDPLRANWEVESSIQAQSTGDNSRRRQ